MRISAIPIIFALTSAFILLLPIYYVYAQEFVQYKVQVNVDGSAIWTITQASDTAGTIDTWQGFQRRVTNLISSAVTQTGRQMSLDNNSLQMNTVWETQSHTTEYQFTWLNFSVVQQTRLVFGDVFQINGFFSQLYGDGEIEFSYPATYRTQSASPQPNGGGTDPHTLDWLGTQFFVNGDPNIILAEIATSPSPTSDQLANNVGWQVYILGLALAVAIAATLARFYFRRPRKLVTDAKLTMDFPRIESEEEKLVKILRASGGSAFQSAITEKCRFSKAKTSQLLTALEKKGFVTRYKRGRDKIVNLTEKGKSETP